MVKGVKKKENNLVKWIVVGLLILAVLFLAFKIFFTGNVVSGTTNSSSLTIHAGDFIYLSNGNYTIKLFSTLNESKAGAIFDPSNYGANFVNIADNVQFSVIWSSAGVGELIFPKGYSYSVIMTGNSMNSSSERSVIISSLQYSISCVSGSCSPTSSSIVNRATCYSVAQSGCLNDRSKSCCSGLTCKGPTNGGNAQGICLPTSSCTPQTCSQLGKQCGTVSNGCSGTLNCGTCSGGKTCTVGHCLGNYGSYCTSGSQCVTGRCKPLFKFLWYKTGNYCY